MIENKGLYTFYENNVKKLKKFLTFDLKWTILCLSDGEWFSYEN